LADFQNPQQDPGMERRLLLVFALTFLVIIASQPLIKKYLPQPPQPPKKEQQAQQQPAQSPPQAPATAQLVAPPSTAATTAKQASAESETVFENDVYKITFTNRGAQVKSWILKKYDNDAQNGPLDLVHPQAASKYGYPLSLWLYDQGQRDKINSALFVASVTGNQRAPGELTFEYAGDDFVVRKTFRFNSSYVLEVDVAATYKGSQVTALPMWPAGFGDENTPAAYASSRVEYQYNSNVERVAAKKVSGGATISGPLNWGGVTDQYFGAVFLPDRPQAASLVTFRNVIDVPKDPQNPNAQDTVKEDVLGAAVGDPKGTTSERLYVGPKSLAVLEKVPVPGVVDTEPDLRHLVDFGWLGVIARPLFLWLRWTYDYVHNWGWAIVIQTLIINLALMPLRISQMKSALKMQKVAPQIKAIQEKYKKYSIRDPRKQEMNQEVSALYKKEGVNPVGGCLPLVIQMPFLFAYYRMLGVAIDLRHAHWIWIKDLSSADPYHILPVAIIITMLFTQRMTPQAGMDPSQQKMMNLIMPVMLGVISWNLAAGLCLYWSEGNLIAMAQQLVMNRTSLGREMREMMEKRARKKDK
jgi:YidC/Oxa1 family membrane protein insertase